MTETKIKKLDTNQICNELQIGKSNTRAYIEHKYKNKSFSLKEWKVKLKKDKLSY